MGVKYEVLREQIATYYAQMPEAVYIGGHIPYSTFLDNITPNPWNYVAILRDPESRLLSHYYYNAHKPRQEHFGIDVGLEEFLESPAGRWYGNNYVWIFMGECMTYEARGDFNMATMRTDETIAMAKRNLDKFAVIGTTKSLPSFEAAIQRHFGASLKIPHVNQNPAKKYPSLKDLSENIRKKMEEICAPDREVFEHA